MDKRQFDAGSYTIEAAFVFPIIIILVSLIILYSFYLHDRVVLAEMSQYYTKKLFQMLDEPVSVSGRLEIERLEEQNLLRIGGYKDSIQPAMIEKSFRESAERWLLVTSVKSVRAEVTDTGVKFSYTADCAIRVLSKYVKMTGIENGFSGTKSIERPLSPEEFVRIIRGIIWRKE